METRRLDTQRSSKGLRKTEQAGTERSKIQTTNATTRRRTNHQHSRGTTTDSFTNPIPDITPELGHTSSVEGWRNDGAAERSYQKNERSRSRDVSGDGVRLQTTDGKTPFDLGRSGTKRSRTTANNNARTYAPTVRTDKYRDENCRGKTNSQLSPATRGATQRINPTILPKPTVLPNPTVLPTTTAPKSEPPTNHVPQPQSTTTQKRLRQEGQQLQLRKPEEELQPSGVLRAGRTETQLD